MTPQEFIHKWKNHALTERAAAQEPIVAAGRVNCVCFSVPNLQAEEAAQQPSRSIDADPAATSSFETPPAPAPQDEVALKRLDGASVAAINADLTERGGELLFPGRSRELSL